jgi:hypothetical protein
VVCFNNRRYVETGDVEYVESGPGPISSVVAVVSCGHQASPGTTRQRHPSDNQDACRVARRVGARATLTEDPVPPNAGHWPNALRHRWVAGFGADVLNLAGGRSEAFSPGGW